eukprot:scaffold1274_cov181-Chaetoceros_neogracile.AAC.7
MTQYRWGLGVWITQHKNLDLQEQLFTATIALQVVEVNSDRCLHHSDPQKLPDYPKLGGEKGDLGVKKGFQRGHGV